MYCYWEESVRVKHQTKRRAEGMEHGKSADYSCRDKKVNRQRPGSKKGMKGVELINSVRTSAPTVTPAVTEGIEPVRT